MVKLVGYKNNSSKDMSRLKRDAKSKMINLLNFRGYIRTRDKFREHPHPHLLDHVSYPLTEQNSVSKGCSYFMRG